MLGLKDGVFNLQSTPIAATYLSFVILSPVWRRIVPPLEIRKVSTKRLTLIATKEPFLW
jgi:hypothetical protein